eukprot:CAMPEP_0204914648 /NCGR_PEP_ID=MMETSP1397-20131031/12549_1 /ASSEMBLY_ACC=CAM_ASM_000891 /TAXON_ID=49980 /ORGANISM="Climacostomum Climacostomum virens, Strain Stock W-24" /LENGTH=413 /DNA_ID=CAMNT_0052086333 /DNA_START=211 /DNA_END=1452 /DNA_ORIENTATION=+
MSTDHLSLLPRIIPILSKNERSPEEIELLLSYLYSLPDLNNYLTTIPRETLLRMCAKIKVEIFMPGTVIFNKGDYSDKFFLIVYGKIEIYNASRDGEVNFKTHLGSGRRLGEQGVITSQPRSLSAVAAERTMMIVMTSSQFRNYLQAGFCAELEVQLSLIERFLPSIENYSHLQKIMIAYCLKSYTFKRGAVMLKKGKLSDEFYIIVNGEASIMSDLPDGSKSILKLTAGALYGEEGVFLNERAKYSVVCASERVVVFYMRKFDALKVLPDEIINNITIHYKAKDRNRKALTVKAKSQKNLFLDHEAKDPRTSFVWATPFARKKLEKLQFKKTSSSNNLSQYDESFREKKDLLIRFSDESQPAFRKSMSFKRRTSVASRGLLQHYSASTSVLCPPIKRVDLNLKKRVAARLLN